MSIFLPQTLDHNPLYTEEELREYEQHLANEENGINKKSAELQKQREELERQQEELNAQRFEIQQVNKNIIQLFASEIQSCSCNQWMKYIYGKLNRFQPILPKF